MKSYNITTNGNTFTLMADNYKVVDGKMIFEASGTIIKEFDNSEIINVETINESNLKNNYQQINS